jgi:nucleoside-diphosphate-sugar epimerase
VRLLLTGASGFIGRNVLLRAPREWEITAVYRRAADFPGFVDAHRLGHVTPVSCDLADARAVGDLGRLAPRWDAALHLAANGDPAASTERVAWDLEQNTVALVNVLERCSIDRMVYMSSGAVYDGLIGAVTPATPVNPLLPYAVSKLASERYVAFFASRRRALASYVNVRFFGAYGPHEPSRKITTRWLRAAMNGDREFTIRGNGANLIDFMYVDDAADALLRVLTDTTFSGTVDLASGTPVTINQLVSTMAAAIGVDMQVRHQGEVPEYIEFRTVDRTMSERFGFSPAIALEDGIRLLHAFISRPALA